MSRSGDCESGGGEAAEELYVDLGHVAPELLVNESEKLARLDEVANDAEMGVQALLVCIWRRCARCGPPWRCRKAVEKAPDGQHAARVNRLRQRVHT